MTGREHGPSLRHSEWFARTLLQCESSLARPPFAAVAVWLSDFKEKVCVLRVRLRLFTHARLPIAFSQRSKVWLVLLFGRRACPPAMWRERRGRPVDYECDFCKCWLPVYKCVHIFSYEHCSPLQPVPHLPSRSSATPPMLLLMKRRWRERDQKSPAIRSKHRFQEKKKGHPFFLLVEGRDVIKCGKRKRVSIFFFLYCGPSVSD